ncbi:MAG TPA: ferritin family protein [Anaeromyxobacteraceae bacterium]|nr:ferritin family protein [Anaeromyxobacteraceae bacterium]
MKLAFAKLTLQDALDLAILIEEEAKERYQEFQKIVGGRYKGDASDVFRNMAVNEEKHRTALAERRHKLFKSAPRRVDRSWFEEVEAPDRGKPRVFMGPKQAFQVALESEEKAYDFFDEALKHVKDPEVKKLFEELKGEELLHQAYIKKAMAKLPAGPDVEEEEADAPGSDAG